MIQKSAPHLDIPSLYLPYKVHMQFFSNLGNTQRKSISLKFHVFRQNVMLGIFIRIFNKDSENWNSLLYSLMKTAPDINETDLSNSLLLIQKSQGFTCTKPSLV